MDKLLSGDLVNAQAMIREGRDRLAPLKDQAFSSMEFGIMAQGIAQEVSLCDVMLDVIDAAMTSGESDPLGILSGFIRDLTTPLASHPKWGYLLNDKGRMSEVIDNMSKATSARFGKSTIPVAAGGGKLLVPFWDVAIGNLHANQIRYETCLVELFILVITHLA